MSLKDTPTFVSVHIIAKETTNFGLKLFKACLESLKNYPDELIIVDDGCSSIVREMIIEVTKSGYGIVKLISAEKEKSAENFTSLRQTALRYTSPQTTFWHWIDTDEVYYPEELSSIKAMLHSNENVSAYVTTLWHFMKDPFHYQYQEIKRNIYRYHPDTKWNKTVHEHVINEHPGVNISTRFSYLHFGYCRTQIETMEKWLRYAILEHGNANCYRTENGTNLPYLRDWRTPNTIIDDRPLKKFEPHYPESLMPMFDEYMNMKCVSWDEYLFKIDQEIGNSWYSWRDKVNSGKATWNDWIDETIKKNEWKENK